MEDEEENYNLQHTLVRVRIRDFDDVSIGVDAEREILVPETIDQERDLLQTHAHLKSHESLAQIDKVRWAGRRPPPTPDARAPRGGT